MEKILFYSARLGIFGFSCNFAFEKKHTAMAKKKKKVNSYVLQKQQAAQYRNLYMERLRKICTFIGDGEPLFDLLPAYIREVAFKSRCPKIRIKVKEGAKITKRFVNIMYAHLENIIKEQTIDLMIPDKDKQVKFIDYFQLILPLDCALTHASKFVGKEKFDAYHIKWRERHEKYCLEIGKILYSACYYYSDMSKQAMYTFTFDMEHSPVTCLLEQTVTLDLYPLDVRHVSIHGRRRPVVQIGIIRHDENISTLVPVTVPLARLHVNDPSGQTEIPVYIQQHAVDRTIQRACCVFSGFVTVYVANAFRRKHKIIREGSRYLVECYELDIKIGYFVGMLIDGLFVILTFLLITNSSTPEGRKLAELTGLQRADISFLAIDDLKTLVNSDIRDNERIAKIFTDAGCESILNMNFKLRVLGEYDWLWDDARQNSELSKLIAEYIQLGNTDEEYFENEVNGDTEN
ncbi:MAG: hypothetical protein LBC47_07950 [Tannerella sp.]|jgi:hypothetical protein|nr:hypothetical protein [Tannerella sp.]